MNGRKATCTHLPLLLSSKPNSILIHIKDHLDRKSQREGRKDGRQRRRSPASTRWARRTWLSGVDITDGSAAHGSPAAWVLLQSRRRWWFGVIGLAAARVPLPIRRWR
ncbi:hypothetical protein HanIR_Chr01g0004921 [Helianthus annuus]|nr:hypothetical protein HanIR_Chr01g0004921 [Helianthus annuus]KAJ0782019.1 hypothetical protein HanLR1_Chr01g0003361 [Helianthus annuus]